jgi:hypothetical protein
MMLPSLMLALNDAAAGHGSLADAVIPKAVEFRTFQRGTTGNLQAIGEFDNWNAHFTQMMRDRRQTVCFLNTQFGCVRNHSNPVCKGGCDSEDR